MQEGISSENNSGKSVQILEIYYLWLPRFTLKM
jgi:hypothetical protein